MSVSKVIFGTETLIDITDTTAIAEDVAEGKTFLSASGVLTTGTNQGGGGTPEAHTITIDSLSKSKVGSVSTLPYSFGTDDGAVIYNNEIHILGGSVSPYTQHYKYNGSYWVSVSTLPYDFYNSCVVIYNNEIHILGGLNRSTYGGVDYHYKWNGSSWTSVSTLPYLFYDGCAVVYNNEIHILGGNSSGTKKHFKYNGSSWTEVSTLPYSFFEGCAVVYDNKIHILGGYSGRKDHYEWDGTSWTQLSNTPYGFQHGAGALVYNDEIHILGGYINPHNQHYKWDGTSWTQLDALPFSSESGYSVNYENTINSLFGTTHYALASAVTTPTSITSNGIYNIVGSKTETALDKLISNLTAKTGTTIDVNIDMSATATADKIMQGYTAWVNGVKLTGTASGGGGSYLQTGTASSTSSLTFSNLSVPYSSISGYVVMCTNLNGVSNSYYWVVRLVFINGTFSGISAKGAGSRSNTSYITVSGSGNSITFTSSSTSYARFTTGTNAYTIMYC